MARSRYHWLIGVLSAAPIFSFSRPHAQTYEPDQVIVKFVNGAAISCRDSSVSLVSGTIVDSVTSIHAYVVQLPDTSVLAAVATLRGRACVEYAEPNYTGGEVLFPAPNDSAFYYHQWYLKNDDFEYNGTPGADIGALQGWAYITSSPDVIVAFLDSGCEIDSPDMTNNIYTNSVEQPGGINEDLDGNHYNHDVHGWDFCNGDYITDEEYWHGTMVASIFGAEGNNYRAMTGVTWHSQILPIKVVRGNGALVNSATLANAFGYAVDMGAKIVNCSWVTGRSDLLANAIGNARDHGVLIVAGAGNGVGSSTVNNDEQSSFWWPANAGYHTPSLDNVISVAFSDAIDSANVFVDCGAASDVKRSHYGPHSVHIEAPGCGLLGIEPTWPSGTPGHAGSSLSAPIISGAAALLWQQNPAWTYSQIKNRLMSTVDTLPSAYYKMISRGRVDIGRALDNVSPSAVTDLAVGFVGRYSQGLTWTDTGDDTTFGQASNYVFKYQTGSAITTDGQFESASPAPLYLGPPGPSGTYHCVVVGGLSSCTMYGWALKLEDPEFNIGGLSNSASATTRCAPPYYEAICEDFLMASGGDGGADGGGEFLIRGADQGANATTATSGGRVPTEVPSALSWRAENGLKIGGEDAVTDLLAMKSIRPTGRGSYSVRLEAAGGRAINLSDASLEVVDHAQGAEAMATPSGIYIGRPGRISSASVNGRSRTAVYQSGEGAVSELGETIDLALSEGEGTTLFAIDLAAQATLAELSSGTVDVQTQDREGAWSTVASIAPRRGLDELAVDVTGASGVRLLVGRNVFIRSISTLTGASEAEPTWLNRSSTWTSRGGQAEDGSVYLSPAEHAVLAFSGAAQEAATQRSVFLRVASRSEEPSVMYGAAREDGASTPQVAFSLTMRPNPAAGRVAVDFTIVHDTNVKIRMYDAAGRLVRTLANGLSTAGTHNLVWDGRSDAGTAVRDGLYFCKMEVGTWVNMKKMVYLSQR